MSASSVAQPEIGHSINAGGVRTNYQDVGKGQPLLLIHGSGPGVTAWANWRLNLPVLGNHFRCLAPDLIGFGYTQLPNGSIRDKNIWVKHVVDFMDAVGIHKACVVGNSFGGAIALALMISHPQRVERAVLMGSVGLSFPITSTLDKIWGYEPSLETMREVLGYLAWDHTRLTDDLVRSRYTASAMPERHQPYAATFGETPRQRHIEMLASSERDLRAIPHEVLILQGKADQVIPYEVAVRLNQIIPNSDLHCFSDCGHWVQIERAESFNRLVLQFFKSGLKG